MLMIVNRFVYRFVNPRVLSEIKQLKLVSSLFNNLKVYFNMISMISEWIATIYCYSLFNLIDAQNYVE